jgi:hypothetical protein
MSKREPLQAVSLFLLLIPPIGVYFALSSGFLWVSVFLFSLIAVGMLLAIFIR